MKIVKKRKFKALLVPMVSIAICLIVFICLQFLETARAERWQKKQITLSGQALNAYVADSTTKREKGLGGFDKLNGDEAMLFIFDAPKRYPFWMKGMKFPIDIIWLADAKVVDISSNISDQPGVSDADLAVYYPGSDVDKVIEVQAGWAEKHNIKIGDQVSAD